MNKISDLEYLKLSKARRFGYKIASVLASIPGAVGRFFLAIWNGIRKIGLGIGKEFADLADTFRNGDLPARVSYVVMGFGNLCRGQILRGLLFLLFEKIRFIFRTAVRADDLLRRGRPLYTSSA